jgi:hypothetical protein
MNFKTYMPFVVAFAVLCVVIFIIHVRESPIASLTQWFSSRVEGFAMPVFTSPRCPPGYKFFTDKTGESFCCNGTVNPYSHACSGNMCAMTPGAVDPRTKKPLPYCRDIMKQMWDAAESQCPKSFPNYSLNNKCCATGSIQDGAQCSAENVKDGAFCTLDDNATTGEKLCSVERLKEKVKCPQGLKSVVTPLSATDVQKYPTARGKSMIRCMDSFSSCFADESIKQLQSTGVFTNQDDSLKLNEASCSKWDRLNVQRNQTAANPLPGKFLLRAPVKNNLCMDDGGGTAPGQTKMHLWSCDARNLNQQFVYDAQTQQIRNPNKNMCVDDGGGVNNGQSKFHLWTCDPNNRNQRFVYNPYTKMFSNPNKRGGSMCIDDGGAYAPGQSKMHIWQCDAANPNQKFEPVRIDTPVGAKVPGVMLLQNPFKQNLCMDDGGGTAPGQTKMHLWTCDKNNMNQQFTYDPMLKQLKNPNKNLCVDDGGGTKYGLWHCDPNNKNQQFVYNPYNQMFANMAKGKCMDDGGTLVPGGTKFDNFNCSAANINQRFKPILL